MQNQQQSFPELACRPVVLRVARSWRMLGYLGVVLFFSVGICLVVLATGSRYNGSDVLVLVSAALVALVMVVCLLALSRARVVLQNDRLRLYDLFGCKEILFSQIAGVRENASENRSILRFAHADPKVGDISVALHFERKKEFVAWAYATFESLDAIDNMAGGDTVSMPSPSKCPEHDHSS